jgi:anti-anti-sigma factor
VLESAAGVTVRVRGVADFSEAGPLDASLTPLLARCSARVTFDLGNLRFVSSLVMGALATYRRAAVRRGVRVYLAPELQPEVRAALDRAGLLDLFETVGGAGAGAQGWTGSEPRPGEPSAQGDEVQLAAGLGI